MKKRFCCLILLLVSALANSQQQYQVSQYMFSQMSYNPAYAGSQDQIELDALVRQQWYGFPGAPVTATFNVNAPVKPFRTQGGIGLSIVNDKIAITNQLQMAATYAFRFNVGNGKLAIGARAGFINNATKFSNLKPKDNNVTLPTDDRGFAFPDIDIGIYYNTEKAYLGFSSIHVSNPVLKYRTGGFENYDITRTFSASAGYKFTFSNPLYELQPSVFTMSDFKITYTDFSSLVLYNKKLWGGLSYRTGNHIFGNAIIFLLGIELKNGVKFGYSYDFVTSPIRKYNIGSHEITLRYGFKLNNEKIPQKYKSIRFL
jgi:type IX secretion system PorP/SprF family membrane protein